MPLDFTFTEEQELVRRSVRDLMTKAVAPRAKELNQARALTPEVHRALTDACLFGLLLPSEYGGCNGNYVTFITAIDQTMLGDPKGFGCLPVMYGATCARLLSVYGSAELKEQVLPKRRGIA